VESGFGRRIPRPFPDNEEPMNLDVTIKQLKREIDHMQATLSVLENLQRKLRAKDVNETARRKAAAAKRKRQPPADAPKRGADRP
jgi:peptidoglycan hydrolase CwlO-like protein